MVVERGGRREGNWRAKKGTECDSGFETSSPKNAHSQTASRAGRTHTLPVLHVHSAHTHNPITMRAVPHPAPRPRPRAPRRAARATPITAAAPPSARVAPPPPGALPSAFELLGVNRAAARASVAAAYEKLAKAKPDADASFSKVRERVWGAGGGMATLHSDARTA